MFRLRTNGNLSITKCSTMVRSRQANRKTKTEIKKEETDLSCGKQTSPYHTFSDEQVIKVREALLSWYDSHKRDLPWRKVDCEDPNQQAYRVWVSEVMLQQTQVATVISYYNNWTKKWPTLQDLAASNIEEVNEMWTGLGYYSRARRLLEGVQKVVREMKGEMPKTAVELEQKLPGVGRYTAAAIASIVYGQVVGVVDGNVVRVMARLRGIGANSTQQDTLDTIWSLANQVVDPKRPGDFNQSLMELGATVCTPKNPSCGQCPVQKYCHAYALVERAKQQSAMKLCTKSHKQDIKPDIVDIECLVPDCHLCLPAEKPWDKQLGVTNFPRKPKKAEVKKEEINSLIINQAGKKSNSNSCESKYLICQRPNKGLLAGMWEFPSCGLVDSQNQLIQAFSEDIGLDSHVVQKMVAVGGVSHQFSHIHHLYKVWILTLDCGQLAQDTLSIQRPTKWVTEDEMEESAVSVGMRKVFKLYRSSISTSDTKPTRKRGRSNDDVIVQEPKKTQATISAFFKSR